MAKKSKPRNGYTDSPHQTIPDHIARRLRELRDQRVGANHMFTAAMVVVRDADWGVPAIAAAVGSEARTVARRIFRGRQHPGVQAALTTLGLYVPPPPVPADQHPDSGMGKRQLVPVPEHIGAHLRELRVLTRQHRFGMPVDHPARVAADHLHADAAALSEVYMLRAIARAAGVTPTAVHHWIARDRRLNADAEANAA